MGDSPVVPYTGYDQAMTRDKARLKEVSEQIARGVPLGEAQASSPLEMPMHYAVRENITDGRPKPAADFNEETLRNLEKVYDELDTQPPAAATVVNFHPIALRVNGGRHFTQHVHPCPPKLSLSPDGEQCTWLTLYEASIDPVPQDSGNHTFDKVPPIWKAQQYMNVANGNPELWGPGAFIYEGDLAPTLMWEENPLIRTFTDHGLPNFEKGQTEIGQRSGRVRQVRKPILRHFREVYLDFWERRNKAYFEIVTRMDSEFHQTQGDRRKFVGINGMTRDQAQVLLNLGLLLEPPEWLIQTRVDSGVAASKCSNCGNDVLAKGLMCHHCNWPVDPYQAFLKKYITIDHDALNDLQAEQLAELYRIDEERKANRARARELANQAPAPPVAAQAQAPTTSQPETTVQTSGTTRPTFTERMRAAKEAKKVKSEKKDPGE